MPATGRVEWFIHNHFLPEDLVLYVPVSMLVILGFSHHWYIVAKLGRIYQKRIKDAEEKLKRLA